MTRRLLCGAWAGREKPQARPDARHTDAPPGRVASLCAFACVRVCVCVCVLSDTGLGRSAASVRALDAYVFVCMFCVNSHAQLALLRTTAEIHTGRFA